MDRRTIHNLIIPAEGYAEIPFTVASGALRIALGNIGNHCLRKDPKDRHR